MNKSIGMAVLLLLALPVIAHASCDEVKSGIETRLKANGVASYTLDVVSGDTADAGGKVVGQCEGDKQIIYSRDAVDATASDNPAPDGAKPASRSAHVAAEPTRAGGCG